MPDWTTNFCGTWKLSTFPHYEARVSSWWCKGSQWCSRAAECTKKFPPSPSETTTFRLKKSAKDTIKRMNTPKRQPYYYIIHRCGTERVVIGPFTLDGIPCQVKMADGVVSDFTCQVKAAPCQGYNPSHPHNIKFIIKDPKNQQPATRIDLQRDIDNNFIMTVTVEGGKLGRKAVFGFIHVSNMQSEED